MESAYVPGAERIEVHKDAPVQAQNLDGTRAVECRIVPNECLIPTGGDAESTGDAESWKGRVASRYDRVLHG